MKSLGPASKIANITGTSSGSGGVIVITTDSAHGLADGNKVLIDGVQGTTEANGDWTVDVLSSTTFSLTGSTYSNTYVSPSGAVYTRVKLRIKAGLDATTNLVVTLSATSYAGGIRTGFPSSIFLLEDTSEVVVLESSVNVSYDLDLITAKNPDNNSQGIYLEAELFDGTVVELKRLTGIAQHEEGQWIKGFPNINDSTGKSRTAGAVDIP